MKHPLISQEKVWFQPRAPTRRMASSPAAHMLSSAKRPGFMLGAVGLSLGEA